MVISKASSPELLVNHLFVMGPTGRPISGVDVLDTETLAITLKNGAVSTCSGFWFFVPLDLQDAVFDLLPQHLHPKVSLSVSDSHKGRHKNSMVTNVSDEFMVYVNQLSLFAVECSACGTKFLVYHLDGINYSAKLYSTSSVLPELTSIAADVLVCDHCSANVKIAF